MSVITLYRLPAQMAMESCSGIDKPHKEERSTPHCIKYGTGINIVYPLAA